jgi:hypothetical protein
MKRLIVIGLALCTLLSVPTAQAAAPQRAHFFVDLTVTTKHEAHVRITYVVKCWTDGVRHETRGQFPALTPFQTTLSTPTYFADRCHAAVWAFNLDHPRGIPKIDLEVVT